MLQRAASNAYSWWWASHIRTRQSKWLEQNLQDMEEKVKNMLKLIDEDGDTFAKRAEMYYRKRPELISYVEESYRAYRALAGRYDHISGELQSANTTIATVFPDKVQFGMDDDEEDDGHGHGHGHGHGSSTKMANVPKEFPDITKGKNLEVSKFRKKAAEGALTFPTKKLQPKKDDSSHLSKTEGVVEIDALQKEILALQTEKEFVKSSYESRLAKYWEIEKKITAMQEKVCSLQDEFDDQGTVIEDEEARTLMASTALKSCQDTLILLQEKQQRSDEEVRVENQRIKAAHERLEALKDEFLHSQTDEWSSSDNKNFKIVEQVDSLQEEGLESKSIHEKTIEELHMDSGASVTMTEMVEKIDELVDKVINLEAAVSSQTALIKRLRFENDELQANLRSLEDDKATKIKDSSNFGEKLGELEKELHGVQDLNRNIEDQNNSLQIQFSEAQYNLDHISEKLQSVEQLDDEIESTGFEQAQAGEFHNSNPFLEFEQREDMPALFDDPVVANEKIIDEALGPSLFGIKDQEEVLAQLKRSSNLDDLFEEAQELNPWKEFLKQESLKANDGVSKFQQEQLTEDDEPDWQQLFLNGMGDREKILLAEYTAVLRNYKDAKRKLSELEQKSCDSLFETTVQLRKLKTSNAMKDEEIRSLRKKLGFLQTSFENTSMKLFEESQRNRLLDNLVKELDSPTLNSNHQDSFSLSPYHDVEAIVTQHKSPADEEVPVTHPREEEIKTILIDEKQSVSSIEEKFRRTIDEVLEENLEFWLRFSTSFHQIQKFQIEIDDLLAEFLRLKENKKQDGSTATTSRSTSTTSSTDQSRNLDALQIFKHLKEIQTRMAIWIDRNVLLKDELQCRFSSLCNIQEEISNVSKTSSETEAVEFTSLMAAKFQGEVLDMQQENNKVADELQAGLDYVRGLEIEVENSLTKLSEDFNLSSSTKNQPEIKHSTSRTRIPLRSFLFGVKVKRRKSSIFQCMNPAFQKQYSDLKAQIHI